MKQKLEYIKEKVREKKRLGTWQKLRHASRLWLLQCFEKQYYDYRKAWIAGKYYSI